VTAIFPVLPGLGWSVTKSPRFAGRIQHAVSGREVRVLDQPYPIWTWTLTYALLRDKWDARGIGGLGAGYDELRTIAGFFLAQQGPFSRSCSTTRPTTRRRPRSSAPATPQQCHFN
jgi:hypothetical protein